jgi:mannosyltransferase OCH1-like enzyme
VSENLLKLNLRYALFWTTQTWESNNKKIMAWLGKKLLVEEKHITVKLTQERAEKNCKNTAPLLTLQTPS